MSRDLSEAGNALLDLAARETGLAAQHIAIDWRVYGPELGAPTDRFAHRADQPFYPCSLVKLFWFAACHARIDAGDVTPDGELDRALHDMLSYSSNTATNYVIDLVTGTTGDTLLGEDDFAAWAARRRWAERWVASLGWPEAQGTCLVQKTMDDDRYGRERQFVDAAEGGHNRLTAALTARIMEALLCRAEWPAAWRFRAAAALHRDLDAPRRPDAQIDGFLAGGLPAGARVWSKAGWTGWTGDARASFRRHDTAFFVAPGLPPQLLTVMTEGEQASRSETLLPALAAAAARVAAA